MTDEQIEALRGSSKQNVLTYKMLMEAAEAIRQQEPYMHRYLTHDVYDLGVSLGYDMSSYTRIEPVILPTPTQPTAHYKHYMKFQKAKRKRR